MPSPLFVTRFGRGVPMLCLHGIEAHGVRYVGLAAYLDGVEIVAPDLRGHGRSPRTGPYTLDQHIDDLLPILRELGPETTLLGHSYGGWIAWELARAAPDALARLVLVDPAMEIGPEDARRYLENAPSRLQWPNHQAAFDELVAGRAKSAHWSVALDVAVGLYEDADGQLRVAVTDEAFRACWEDHVMNPISQSAWRGPTLVIEAAREHGAFLAPSALADMRRQLGDQLRHEVVDLPHTITGDGPDILADVVRPFLSA